MLRGQSPFCDDEENLVALWQSNGDYNGRESTAIGEMREEDNIFELVVENGVGLNDCCPRLSAYIELILVAF